MANKTGGHTRYRLAGKQAPRLSGPPTYGPAGTGCPVIERAIRGLYRAQTEESFWTLMNTLNYAMQLETRVLVPVQTVAGVHTAPAPWTEHPIPPERTGGLPLWTLRSDKGKNWLPLFTSSVAAGAERSTATRPMAEKTLEEAMTYALETPGIDGVVLDPWTHSATLEGSLLNGLLHGQREQDEPGEAGLAAGIAAEQAGDWAEAARQYDAAGRLGSAAAVVRLGHCHYGGLGVRRSRTEARRLWKQAAEAGEPLALVALGDDCADAGKPAQALLHYRRARQLALRQPDITFMPEVCLRIVQAEVRYVDLHEALVLIAEAAQGFYVRHQAGDPEALGWLEETRRLAAELAAPPPRPIT